MQNHNIPVFNLNMPGGSSYPPQTQPTSNTPVYSAQTGNLIGYGPIPFGTSTDAPSGHPKYGKNFDVIEYNSANNTYMAN